MDFDRNTPSEPAGENVVLLCSMAVSIITITRRRRKRLLEAARRHRLWSKPWLLRRRVYGTFETLMQELEAEDRPGYKAFQRVYPEVFRELLEKVAPHIRKENTNMRMAIPPEVRLALTLRFLASGNTYMSLQFSFRVAANTIGRIIPETCITIYEALRDEFFKCPTTEEEWIAVAEGFYRKWQFPNCIGALDGKHVMLRKPGNTGSTFYNYKNHFSIVLMALVDADYRFLYVDIGSQGRISDGGVFAATTLHKALENQSLHIPPPRGLPGDERPIPLFMIGDEAFPLRTYIMKPFPARNLSHPERIFNYRLSRARRVVENAFGILANRFRVLLSPMLLAPDRAEDIVLACCAIHNLLRERYPVSVQAAADAEDSDSHQVIAGSWRRESSLGSVRYIKGNNTSRTAKEQRQHLCQYVNGPNGAVEWQDRMV